jgi:hypothetical protein
MSAGSVTYFGITLRDVFSRLLLSSEKIIHSFGLSKAFRRIAFRRFDKA